MRNGRRLKTALLAIIAAVVPVVVLHAEPPGMGARQTFPPTPTATLLVEGPGVSATPRPRPTVLILEIGTGGQPAPPVPATTAPGSPPSQVDSFNDVVAVGGRDAWNCTGVLVTPVLVLTAKHCGDATRVAFGTDVSRHPQVVPVTRVVRNVSADVEALMLARPVGVAVRPRRTNSVPPNGGVELVGFGTTDPTGRSGYGIKRHVEVPQHGWGCDAARAQTIGCSLSSEMVIGRNGGNDTCAGDSGAPVFEWVGSRWQLLAITSRGVPSLGVPCGNGGIYVRVDVIEPWIRTLEAQ